MAKRNFRPAAAPRDMAGQTLAGDPVRIGVFASTEQRYWRGVIRGVAAYAQFCPSWVLHLVDPKNGVGGLGALKLDGAIAAITNGATADALASLGRPVVNVAGYGDKRFIKVGNDDEAIGRAGATHFLQRGFHFFLYVGAEAFLIGREKGFRQTLCDAGRDCVVPAVPYPLAPSSEAVLRQAVRSLARPAAVMAATDTLAAQMVHLCVAEGLRVPHDVAVLGVNNDELVCSLCRPSLSSVAPAVQRIGYEAAGILDGLLNGGARARNNAGRPTPWPGRGRPADTGAPGSIGLPPLGVVARRSTEVLAIDDPDVGEAVEYIRAHSNRPLSVDEVLEVVSLSRSSLQRRFRHTLGQSPREYIQRAHIDRAKSLLVDSRLSIKRIAAESGFANVQHFYAMFRKAEDATPKSYRARFRTAMDAPEDADEFDAHEGPESVER